MRIFLLPNSNANASAIDGRYRYRYRSRNRNRDSGFAATGAIPDSSLERRRDLIHDISMLSIEEIAGEEWAEWYRLTPIQRWRKTGKLWHTCLMLGGSLDPEPDTQSPFHDPRAPRARAADGRPGVRIIRRSGV
jgi:hypothetical protein